MIKDLEKMLAPLGTRENPAISCLDLSLCHGDQFSAGESTKHFVLAASKRLFLCRALLD